MKRYTQREKTNGELAIRDLSAKAREVYNGTDPLAVFGIDIGEGTRYDVRGMYEATGLTFEELEQFLEGIQDELDAIDDEDGEEDEA